MNTAEQRTALNLIDDLINAVETLQGLCGNEPPDDTDPADWTHCEVVSTAAAYFIDTIKETS